MLYMEVDIGNEPGPAISSRVFVGGGSGSNGVTSFITWEPFDLTTYARWRGISVDDATAAIDDGIARGALVLV
jgi:hypothetical protein